MKKILLILAVTFTFSGCEKKEEVKKEELNGTMIFYKTNNSESYSLIWEGKDDGAINYSAQAPPCGAPGFITKDVAPGNYSVNLKGMNAISYGGIHTITIESGKCKFYPCN